MTELRESNGDYTEEGLKYPGMTADIDICYKYLHELCQIVWAGNPNRPANMVMWSIPPQPYSFDLQISAALDELKAYRDTGLSPERVAELAEAEKDGRLVVLPISIGNCFYGIKQYIDKTCEIYESKVKGYRISRTGTTIQSTKNYSMPITSIDDYGLYITRAEAETALKRREAEL